MSTTIENIKFIQKAVMLNYEHASSLGENVKYLKWWIEKKTKNIHINTSSLIKKTYDSTSTCPLEVRNVVYLLVLQIKVLQNTFH